MIRDAFDDGRLAFQSGPEAIVIWRGLELGVMRVVRFLSAVGLAAVMSVSMLMAAGTVASAKPVRVKTSMDYPMGAIVIVNDERKLYYMLGNGRAIRYPVAVGNRNEIWTGKHVVTMKRKNPSWRHPNGGRTVPGGPGNPLGVRALYLGWTLWRIHGTPSTGSIGRAVSNGCIRMFNSDVTDLYDRVHIGAPVYVIRSKSTATADMGWGKKLIHQRRSRRVASR